MRVGVLLGLLVLGACGESRIRPRPFDADAWRTNHVDESGISPRLAMVPDLVREHLRPGTPRSDVVALLGEPLDECWSDAYPHPGWNLGRYPETSGATVLSIEFDAEDTVQCVRAPYWGSMSPRGSAE